MAITVDSSQWTGQRDETPLAVPVVWGEFADEAAKDAALARLREAGARRHDEMPAETGVSSDHAANEGQVDAPDVDPKGADIRNQRQLQVGTAMAATSMAAAGLVIATGGAALPAMVAAVAAGAATAAVGEPVANAVAPQSGDAAGTGAMEPPRAEGPVIGLQAPDDGTRSRAEQALREAGARRVFVQTTRAG
ncbi:hypothetical protein [Falsiroseomonas sp. HW251]|uniref:hypothetical protein n=1 Tax=Falsiroseomonas sp. HW251 TaxID=3390998 RepID=UPI003D32362F